MFWPLFWFFCSPVDFFSTNFQHNISSHDNAGAFFPFAQPSHILPHYLFLIFCRPSWGLSFFSSPFPFWAHWVLSLSQGLKLVSLLPTLPPTTRPRFLSPSMSPKRLFISVTRTFLLVTQVFISPWISPTQYFSPGNSRFIFYIPVFPLTFFLTIVSTLDPLTPFSPFPPCPSATSPPHVPHHVSPHPNYQFSFCLWPF